jgi:hypothetical protein
MGAVAVVVPQPIAHGDGDVVVTMEPPPVGELPAEAGVVALDDPVLPGRARVDGERADAEVGKAVPDGTGDKLGARCRSGCAQALRTRTTGRSSRRARGYRVF